MRILFDTSVLVAAMVAAHPAYERAFPWLQRVHTQENDGLIAVHSLAELYSVLTTLPLRPPVLPEIAQRMIAHNILSTFQIISLIADDYQAVITHLSSMALSGGIIYDALIGYAAIKANADQIITLNAKDFHRIYPNLAARIVVP